MCGVCGCGDGETRIEGVALERDHDHSHEHGHAHEHEHVLADGTVVRHSHHHHGHDHDHGADLRAPREGRLVAVERDILERNDRSARHNRAHFAQAGLTALNLVSSPGAGKTTLLVRTIEALLARPERVPLAVIEGDQETANDAERIRAAGAPAVQINTGKGCHLDADMVHEALHRLPVERGGLLFIENVGNLVCPAGFDLGESYRVVIASVTEGEDKPLKYPDIFATADLLLVSKVDLAPHVEADVELLVANARKVKPDLPAIALSARSGAGMERWLAWLDAARALRAAVD